MQLLQRTTREKKPGLNKERVRMLIEQRQVAEPEPKQVPNRKRRWSQNLIFGLSKEGKKELEGHMRPKEKKQGKHREKSRKSNGN